MTPKDREAFSGLMLRMSLTCRTRAMSENEAGLMLEAYFEALEPYDIGEVRHAVSSVIREPGRVFFPTIGELVEYIQADRRERRLRRESERRILPAASEPTEEERAEVRKMLDELGTKFKL